MTDLQQEQAETKNPTLNFIREVAKYFMDFLETDFHKRRNPKRSVKLHSEDNLLLGLNLDKYPSFNALVWEAINHNFGKDVLNKIGKGVFKTSIPQNLLDLINLQIDKLSVKNVSKIILEMAEVIENSAVTYKKEYDKALAVSLENASTLVKQGLVIPFVQSLEKSLENLQLGDENSVFIMEEELAEVLMKLLENKISEILKLLLSGNKTDIAKEIKRVFSLREIRENLIEFFDDFKVTDLFAEIFEMDRNRSILDKQEFYLYFCDITFNKAKYPIFYIPLALTKNDDAFSLEFDAQVYINKRALEYIVQEYNKDTGKKGGLNSVTERIIYLAQHQEDFQDFVEQVVGELANFFEVDRGIDTTSAAKQTGKSLMVRISNSCYITLFDKSDEALVNDYEEILQMIGSDSILGEAFNKLIDDFIHKNPEPFNPAIEEGWNSEEVGEKLVSASPIPLNSEQRQILSAIKKDGCKYIIVEGPPGTGKSHTITAIVFNTILNNQSVLVLSDKKEALDVVEDKITETMNKVRHDKNFQNPILRLGKTGSTYSQILANSAIDKIKLHYWAVKKDYENLEDGISNSVDALKEDLEAEAVSYGNIEMTDLREVTLLENEFKEKKLPFDWHEVLAEPESSVELEELRKVLLNLKQIPNRSAFLQYFEIPLEQFDNISSFQNFLGVLGQLGQIVFKVKEIYRQQIKSVAVLGRVNANDLVAARKYIGNYNDLKGWLFGYAFKKQPLEELRKQISTHLPLTGSGNIHQNIRSLKDTVEIYNYVLRLKDELGDKALSKIDYLNIIHNLLRDDAVSTSLQEVINLNQDILYVHSLQEKYPKTFREVGINPENLGSYRKNALTELGDTEFDKLVRFLNLKQKLQSDFGKIESSNYPNQKEVIENLITTQMTYLMDGRLIKFYEYNKATAKTLRDIIKSKQRFPKEEFAKLKEAFPCILAGIRDYAEYIPLEPDIFDLVIIDEASQVSIAQAFPALLRAKKVLILGDKKQFSNIKAAQAKSDTNREYLNNLEYSFKKNISQDTAKLVRLGKFNIKTSILEFFEYISNYNIQLVKYFRGYKEIISYSKEFFYQGNLQVMKIRGKPIDEVLKFSIIPHDGKMEIKSNSNSLEVDFIISELRKLRDREETPSVGIITPHTDQQKLLVEMINNLPERDYYFDKLKLKIMTFDTCQGEERDIIYYSMVATKEYDHLWGVFVRDLGSVDVEEDGKIKAQRLNVGFSRAKERMHFVLSKPLEDFNGSIGEALKHYHYQLEEAKKERSIAEVDKNSKMEPEVLHWFYQTKFWKDNQDNIVDFIPQFKIGEYLKQLDPTYNHPMYKVDFLLVYKDELGKEHKIIIEYDGFNEHFTHLDEVNQSNYQSYYTEADLYREKVLESYGYRFLRINRFNAGDNPVKTLESRINAIIKGGTGNNGLLDGIHATIDGLENGRMKECPKCKEIRGVDDFRDSSRLTGFGRFCRFCKKAKVQATAKQTPKPYILSDKICPRCSSRMILRRGRYGQFYGCSKFPYCKATLRVVVA